MQLFGGSIVQQLNYHHLHYFWLASREGSITAAAKRLGVTTPTASAQIRALEKSVGQPLFERRGRHLTLTESGTVVQRYADEIFGLGTELLEVLGEARGSRHATRLRVGVASDLPKLVVYRILSPLLQQQDNVHLIVHQDRPERLLGDLSVYHLDLVLAGVPLTLGADVPTTSRQLGTSTVSFVATPKLAAELRAGFPDTLNHADMLLPEVGSTVRHAIERWAVRHNLSPHVVAEFHDSALLKVFGRHGAGVFPVPTSSTPY